LPKDILEKLQDYEKKEILQQPDIVLKKIMVNLYQKTDGQEEMVNISVIELNKLVEEI
jgi:hypothetical protein